MSTYYIIYGLLLFSVIFETSTLKTKKMVMKLWCLFFTLFVGLRWNTGTDWDSYLMIFETSNFDNIFSFDRTGGSGGNNMEPGFVFLNALIRHAFKYFWAFNTIVEAFVQYTFYKVCLKYCRNTPLLAYAILMVFCQMFPVRATLAMTIIYWGYQYIQKRKFVNFLLIIALGYTIHMKVLIFLPFYWAGKIRLHDAFFYIIYGSFVAFYVIFQDYITAFVSLFDNLQAADKFVHYTETETIGYGGMKYAGVALNFFFIFIYCYMRRIKQISDDEWGNGILNMYLACICIYALFSDGMGDLAGLATIFMVPQIILLTRALYYFEHCKYAILRVATLFFFVAYYIYKIHSATSGYFFEECNVPYESIFGRL